MQGTGEQDEREGERQVWTEGGEIGKEGGRKREKEVGSNELVSVSVSYEIPDEMYNVYV